jgi:hypothetical protein
MVQVGHRTRMRWCKYTVPDPCRGIQFIGASGDKLYDCASRYIITTRSDSNSKTIELSLTNVSTHDAGNYSCVGTTSSHQQDTLVVYDVTRLGKHYKINILPVDSVTLSRALYCETDSEMKRIDVSEDGSFTLDGMYDTCRLKATFPDRFEVSDVFEIPNEPVKTTLVEPVTSGAAASKIPRINGILRVISKALLSWARAHKTDANA